MFQGKTSGSFVAEGNAFATNLTYNAPGFILAFWRSRRASGIHSVSGGRVISRWGRLALARIANTLVSARGDGSKGHAHEGADSDGDANEVATLQVTFWSDQRAQRGAYARMGVHVHILGYAAVALEEDKKKRKRKKD